AAVRVRAGDGAAPRRGRRRRTPPAGGRPPGRAPARPRPGAARPRRRRRGRRRDHRAVARAPACRDEGGLVTTATTAARVLLRALADLGLRHVVLAPGSRSAPLAYAAAAAAGPDGERPDGAPALDLHVRVDERCAGFLAVGLA